MFVIFAAGLLFDVLATLTAFLPLFAVVSMFRLRWLRPRLRMALVGAICFALCFDAFVQFFFFDEYSARYNHLALDYLMYPDEVFGNIFASYNVPLFAGIARRRSHRADVVDDEGAADRPAADAVADASGWLRHDDGAGDDAVGRLECRCRPS